VLSNAVEFGFGLALQGLNAPSGAGYFLTFDSETLDLMVDCLNAPSGAGCFLTWPLLIRKGIVMVLMHLLVLGAF